MKKLIPLILTVCMLLTLVACGDNTKPAETPVETPVETPAETPSETPVETPSEAPSETPSEVPSEAPAEAEVASYTYVFEGLMGSETAQIDLAADGTCRFFLPGNAMLTDVYAGTYTRDGNAVSIVGLTNVDASSSFKTPGLWDWIVNGNASIIVDDASQTFTPADGASSPADGPAAPADGPAAPAEGVSGSYTYVFAGLMGDETAQFDLAADGTCQFSLPGNPMLADVYAGTYTASGNIVSIVGLTNVDASSSFKTPGLWDWIVDGSTTITINAGNRTFTPGAAVSAPADGPSAPAEGVSGSYTYVFAGLMGDETAQFDLAADGTCQFFLPGNAMLTDVYAGTYTANGNTVIITGLTNVDASSSFKTPGLWDWIVDGNTTITVNAGTGTFTPAV